LVKAAARDKNLLVYLEANQSALDKQAKIHKTTLAIPGIVPYDDANISAREK
jgi:hypothetical protein